MAIHNSPLFMSLYTKYRPRDWDSVIGQDRIKTILKNSLTHDRTGHAYLFHGSRGTGKTTSARILAKGVNCLSLRDGNPCHECANCIAFDNGTMLDIIEIDAASNTGVDNIRELIERARFEPNQGKYKVYIIDEVHMLSTGAFNALLKTLEEPPAHVKFILATTEAEKVPETIRSRALRFDFRKITESDIIERLGYVIKAENIQADPVAVKIIAKYARGGLRDALTLLEQTTIDSEVSLEHVRMTLSLLEESYIDEIIESVRISDTASILDIIGKLRDTHVNARGFFEQIMYRLRDLTIAHLDDTLYHDYMELYRLFEESYTRVRAIPDGMLLIEMTLLRIGKRGDRKEEIGDRTARSEIKKETIKTDANSKTGAQEKKIIAQNRETEGDKLSESDESNTLMSKANEFLSPSGAFGTFQSGKVQKENSAQGFPTKTLGNDGDTRFFVPQNDENNGQELITPPSNNPTTLPFSYITLLDRVKSVNPVLVVDLKTARFEVTGNKITFIFSKNWNYSRVNTPDIRGTLSEVLSSTFGGEWSVECRIDESKSQAMIADDVF